MNASNTADNNRRRIPRYPRCVDITVQDEGGRSPHQDPKLLDISPRGFGLQVSEAVESGGRVRFRMALPDGLVSGTASVRWASPNESGYRCGFLIEDISWGHWYRLREFVDPSRLFELSVSHSILRVLFAALLLACLTRAMGAYLATPAEILSTLLPW